MFNRRILAVSMSCLLITACAAQWSKTGVSPETVNADVEACERLAMEQFPVDLSKADSGNQKDYETRCTSYGHQTSCTTRSSDTGASDQYDRNADERKQAVGECMRLKGYSRS